MYLIGLGIIILVLSSVSFMIYGHPDSTALWSMVAPILLGVGITILVLGTVIERDKTIRVYIPDLHSIMVAGKKQTKIESLEKSIQEDIIKLDKLK